MQGIEYEDTTNHSFWNPHLSGGLGTRIKDPYVHVGHQGPTVSTYPVLWFSKEEMLLWLGLSTSQLDNLGQLFDQRLQHPNLDACLLCRADGHPGNASPELKCSCDDMCVHTYVERYLEAAIYSCPFAAEAFPAEELSPSALP